MFSLVLANGQRHVVHLVDSGVAIPEGHLVTAVWAARKGASSGAYVAFFDQSWKTFSSRLADADTSAMGSPAGMSFPCTVTASAWDVSS